MKLRLHKYIQETIDRLWNDKNSYFGGIVKTPSFTTYINYGGFIPKKIMMRLTKDFIKAINSVLPPSQFKTKAQFRKAILDSGLVDIRSISK